MAKLSRNAFAAGTVRHIPFAGGVVSAPVEAALHTRYGAARERADELQEEYPNLDARGRAEIVARRSVLLLGTSGAAAGGVSAVPTVGTVAAVAVVTTELGVSLAALTEMIMTIGTLYGHDGTAVEARRTWALAVLALALEVDSYDTSDRFGDTAVLRPGGATSADQLSPRARRAVNEAIAGRIMVRLGVRAGVVQLGRLLPLGIGAVIGGVTSTRFARSVADSAMAFFGPTGPVVTGVVVSAR